MGVEFFFLVSWVVAVYLPKLTKMSCLWYGMMRPISNVVCLMELLAFQILVECIRVVSSGELDNIRGFSSYSKRFWST